MLKKKTNKLMLILTRYAVIRKLQIKHKESVLKASPFKNSVFCNI